MATLLDHVHGKEKVRLARVWRLSSGVHYFVEWSVSVVLESDMAHAYIKGDNTGMTATDTMKNTVYIIAKRMTQRCSPERYAMELAEHFVQTYPKVTGCRVVVDEKPWRRVSMDGVEHDHGYAQTGTEIRVAKVYACRGKRSIVNSGIRGMTVLKTTQSGYEGYIKDQYTSLPDTRERIVASSVDAQWGYAATVEDYDRAFSGIKKALLDAFFGPPKSGVYSPSVQYTLHEMGKLTLSRVEELDAITLTMPNLHFLPFSHANSGSKFEHDVYIATSEPHGNICATVARSPSSLRAKL